MDDCENRFSVENCINEPPSLKLFSSLPAIVNEKKVNLNLFVEIGTTYRTFGLIILDGNRVAR